MSVERPDFPNEATGLDASPLRRTWMRSFVATVEFNGESRLWRADVPNIPGASATARTLNELSVRILEATAFALDVAPSEIRVTFGKTNA